MSTPYGSTGASGQSPWTPVTPSTEPDPDRTGRAPGPTPHGSSWSAFEPAPGPGEGTAAERTTVTPAITEPSSTTAGDAPTVVESTVVEPASEAGERWGKSLPPESGFFAPEGSQEALPPPPAAGPPKPPREPRSRLPLVIALAVAVVVLAVTLLGFVWPAFLVRRVLDAGAVEEGVTRVLTDAYQEKVQSASCPANRELRPGNTFECVVRIDDQERTVPVTVKTEDGQYEVARPK